MTMYDAHMLTYLLSFLDLFYEKRYSHTAMTNPDFVLLAKAMGVHAIRCHSVEELPEKMKEFLEYDNSKPIVMECIVEKNEHVFPMVRLILCIIMICPRVVRLTIVAYRFPLARLYMSSCFTPCCRTRRHEKVW